MKIKVYVDWRAEEVINEAEYTEIMRQEVEKLMAIKDDFYNWLINHYTLPEIWELTEAGRDEVRKFWMRECVDAAEREATFEMIELEI